ncbi:MAG: DUF2142 domain-containing protein [Lachnospiraceae bacterium]|nr:DUF2142 domain-containing protein [Lachnospiraceae bacterium]
MNKKCNITGKEIIKGAVMLLVLAILCLLVYKAQLEPKLDNINTCTLMWEHKENSYVELSAQKTSLTQVFTCTVPRLRRLQLQCVGKNINPNTQIEISLTEPGSGKEYYYRNVPLSDVVNNKKQIITLKMKNLIKNSENKQFILSVMLINPEDSVVRLSANYKTGIVTSFDGVQENKTNVIYAMKYYNTGYLKQVYGVLCGLLLLIAALSYYWIIVRKYTVERFYIPIALLLGLVVQCVIVVHGVPDEPWHMDTAYKLSNDILFVKDSEQPGVILKRQCDIVMSDMLANGVESNSYYQLWNHTFEKPENVELVETAYTDSSNLVPDFIYLPTALGISLGRLLNLSAMLTLQLGRICNLLVFVLLVWLAIKQLPYGKNVMAALGFTPIALQQAASASYDPMITGIAFLFVATVLKLVECDRYYKRDIALTVILTGLLGLVKSGVYLPIACLLLLVVTKSDVKQKLLSVKKRWYVVGFGCVIAFAGIILYKFMPVISSLMLTEIDTTNENSLYSLSYVLDNPLQVICLYWNTFIRKGTNHLAGLLGGKLSWLDVQMSWVFLVIILISVLLLVNVDGDTYRGTKKGRVFVVASCLVSIFLIMASMLFACTTLGHTYIAGIQGRYYLPFAPALFMVTANSMIKVNKEQCGRIWMTLVVVDIMIIMQFFIAVL